MAKKLYTSKDIVNLVNEQQVTTLTLTRGDLITPMARDTARELGVEIIDAPADSTRSTPPPAVSLPAAAPGGSELETKVRLIVQSLLTQNRPPEQAQVDIPVIHVDGRSLTMPAFPFEINRPHMDVRLEDVITHQHGAPMAAGFMSLHKGSFPWTLTYDEIEYVIEGELHIGTAQGTVVAKPGDVLYIPKGTSITFGTPSWAKFLYVTYPAEWAS